MRQRVIEVLVWWAVLAALELLLISSVSVSEVVLALGLGLVGGLVATAARSAEPVSWTPDVRWLRWLLSLPFAVVRDTGAVLRAAFSGARGSWRTVESSQGAGDGSREGAWRALAVLVLSASPATVVAEVDHDTGRLLVHDFAASPGSALEQVVTR